MSEHHVIRLDAKADLFAECRRMVEDGADDAPDWEDSP